VHGSLTLARTLLAAQLVDELRLVVAPSLASRYADHTATVLLDGIAGFNDPSTGRDDAS
jgi:riboflavin biosynthesis pyrimidine reductase